MKHAQCGVFQLTGAVLPREIVATMPCLINTLRGSPVSTVPA